MIRFLFLESMLLGAFFRKRMENTINKNKFKNWIMAGIFFVLYFASKLILSKNILVEYQIINQIILFILLYYIFKVFAGMNNKLEKLPIKVKDSIQFIAKITLEIYLVQYEIIPIFKDIIFPLNWIIITVSIVAVAYALHKLVELINKIIKRRS